MQVNKEILHVEYKTPKVKFSAEYIWLHNKVHRSLEMQDSIIDALKFPDPIKY